MANAHDTAHDIQEMAVEEEEQGPSGVVDPPAPPKMNELLLQFRENLFGFILKCRGKNTSLRLYNKKYWMMYISCLTSSRKTMIHFLHIIFRKMASMLKLVLNLWKFYSLLTFSQRHQSLLGLHKCRKVIVNPKLKLLHI